MIDSERFARRQKMPVGVSAAEERGPQVTQMDALLCKLRASHYRLRAVFRDGRVRLPLYSGRSMRTAT